MSRGFARLTLLGWTLIALSALLSAVISLELRQSAAEPVSASPQAPEPASSAKPPASQGATLAFAPLQQYSEIVERTLFDASRRPAPEELDEMPAAAAELREFTLTGVVITPEAKIALLRDRTPNQVIRVEQGGALGKWLLEEVRDDGVTLRRGMARRELRLHEVEDPARLRSASEGPAAMAATSNEPTAAQSEQAGAPQAKRTAAAPAQAENPGPKVPRTRRRARRFSGATPAPGAAESE